MKDALQPIVARDISDLCAVPAYRFNSSLVVPIVRLKSQPHPITATAKTSPSIVLLTDEPNRVASLRLSDSASGRSPHYSGKQLPQHLTINHV